jgi:oligopeptide transport system substrate-binding protein
MRTPRFAACLAIPISVALLTSACGGSGGGPGSGGSGGRQTDATISVNSTEPENPLIPGNTNETGGGKVVDALFTGLVEYDPKTAEPRNAVAQSIETTDSKLYTIKLKPGWTFHDGTPVTAQNFVDAWNYTAYSPNGQQNASFFAQIAGFDQVNTQDPDGANGPLAAPQPAAQTMSGLRAVDDQTLEVTLAEPFSVFPTQLGYQAFMPLPRAFFTNQAAFEATPIGNGPFRFVSRQPGANIVLERYEQYGGERKPGVKGVEYRFYESAEAAYADVVSNNLDFIEIIPPSAIAGNLFETDLPNRSVSQTYLGLSASASRSTTRGSRTRSSVRRSPWRSIGRRSTSRSSTASSPRPTVSWRPTSLAAPRASAVSSARTSPRRRSRSSTPPASRDRSS